MQFKVLSHACLLVTCAHTKIIMDPWLLGSCYWRSWWNFPRADFDPAEIADVDAVIISHVHWDHWHGPTLKRYFAGKPVIIPDEPGLRSETDLRAIGFKDIRRVAHGRTLTLGVLSITMYQFGRYLNDAAIVVQGDGVTLLNANDAKIAGLPLTHLVERHAPIDFAFRSHSSANSRVCFKMAGDDTFVPDDREHYLRSFVAFMNVVKPRFAIPFASNHCHLHDDVFELNGYVSNPLQLREYCTAIDKPWALQVMLPGSSWSGREGQPGTFELRSESCFENIGETLSSYRAEVSPTLERYRRQEAAVTISARIMARFMAYFKDGRGSGAGGKIKLALRWPDGERISYLCDLEAGTFRLADTPAAEPVHGVPVLDFPAIVFRDAVVKNMFGHAGISKRCLFLASSDADMDRLKSICAHLDQHELGALPASRAYRWRLVSAYVRRWRELWVYAQALWLLKIRRMPIYLVEEAVLRGEF